MSAGRDIPIVINISIALYSNYFETTFCYYIYTPSISLLHLQMQALHPRQFFFSISLYKSELAMFCLQLAKHGPKLSW